LSTRKHTNLKYIWLLKETVGSSAEAVKEAVLKEAVVKETVVKEAVAKEEKDSALRARAKPPMSRLWKDLAAVSY
jgi:hypothetical protein